LKFSLNKALASSGPEVELIYLISKNLPPSQFSYAEGWRIVAEKKAQFMKLCAVIRIIVMPLQGTARLYKTCNNSARYQITGVTYWKLSRNYQ
jgi:hypothetical protein